MGLLGKVMNLATGGGPERVGLDILKESLEDLRATRALNASPSSEARALRAVLGRLRARGLVGQSSEREALDLISAHEGPSGGAQ